jgi:23S rRNA (adenine2503-C2)-methyltransferase
MSQVSIYDSAGVDRLRAELRVEPQCVRRMRTVFLKKSQGAHAALAELPADVRDEFARRAEFHSLSVESRFESEVDGATKLALRTRAGYLIEAVILRTGTGRVALCISCQVGCAAACEFCATGQMGIARNLSAAEIFDQVVLAGELLHDEGRTVRNIVFMGMGEPFHNEAVLYDVLAALQAPESFHWPAGRILVSTVGISDALVRCARRFPEVNLALSLHSVRQEVRERLIPLATRYPLDELWAALEQLNRIQRQPVMIEYLMLAGLNDAPDDARELLAWLAGLDVHVNLIPYNPIDGQPKLHSTDRPERDAFAAILRAAGLTATIRYSLGADIAAACGQLVQRENRHVARQQRAMPSV